MLKAIIAVVVAVGLYWPANYVDR